MRLRNKPWAPEYLAAHPEVVAQDAAAWYGKWQERFPRTQPIYIEVGSGKGRFIAQMAKKYPAINFIGIEMQVNAIVTALDHLLEEEVDNLQLLAVNGAELTDFFAPNEVDQIFLNFSDPWPKKRHAKRRLTSPGFLKIYQEILRSGGELHFKTDNRPLFEYSLASFSQFGLTLKQVWLDLHQDAPLDNVMTEYEEKFVEQGKPIYRAEVQFPPKKA